ncbi:MAG TPA: hypothetical protein VGM39_16295 [Kofleriaceae bacterium]|jgi:hypothetical protein
MDDELRGSEGPCFLLTLDTRHVPEPVGDPVALRIIAPPKGCRALAPRRPVPYPDGPRDVPGDEDGVSIFASQKEFRERFRCAPGTFDFAQHQLGVAWNDTSGRSRYVVERAVKSGDGISLVVGLTPECKPPKRLAPAMLVELPRTEGSIGLAMCPRVNPACPDR